MLCMGYFKSVVNRRTLTFIRLNDILAYLNVFYNVCVCARICKFLCYLLSLLQFKLQPKLLIFGTKKSNKNFNLSFWTIEWREKIDRKEYKIQYSIFYTLCTQNGWCLPMMKQANERANEWTFAFDDWWKSDANERTNEQTQKHLSNQKKFCMCAVCACGKAIDLLSQCWYKFNHI